MDIKQICLILNELYTDFRYEEEFKEYFEYNDLGLPLAVVVYEEIVSLSPRAQVYIEESYLLLLQTLGIEDKHYESLAEMLFESGKS